MNTFFFLYFLFGICIFNILFIEPLGILYHIPKSHSYPSLSITTLYPYNLPTKESKKLKLKKGRKNVIDPSGQWPVPSPAVALSPTSLSCRVFSLPHSSVPLSLSLLHLTFTIKMCCTEKPWLEKNYFNKIQWENRELLCLELFENALVRWEGKDWPKVRLSGKNFVETC